MFIHHCNKGMRSTQWFQQQFEKNKYKHLSHMTPNEIVELTATGWFRGQSFKDELDKFMQGRWYQ